MMIPTYRSKRNLKPKLPLATLSVDLPRKGVAINKHVCALSLFGVTKMAVTGRLAPCYGKVYDSGNYRFWQSPGMLHFGRRQVIPKFATPYRQTA